MARGRSDDRTPPHNVEAEESVLGAALVAERAAAIVAALDPGDFYVPHHQTIAAAIRTLVADGDPVDAVTVGEELRRRGEAHLVPEGTLHRLISVTPSLSAAPHYGEIVANAATLRRVLWSAADIADVAYSNADPIDALGKVSAIVDKLGAKGVREGSSTLEIADVAALLETDLEPEEAAMMVRADGRALIYPGKMHMFQAEPTSGKSWLACYLCAEVIGFGGTAVWIDHEDSPQGILGRMLALGVDPAHLAARFKYLRPLAALGPIERAELFALLDEANPDVVIIDGVANALGQAGYDESSNTDVVRWFDQLPRPIARTGAAVILLDHVAKDKDSQGRWARGAGAKLGEVDAVAYQVKVVTPFSRNRPGRVKMVIAKDRPGGVGAVGETAAVVNVTPHGNGARVVIELEPPEERKAGDPWKPTHIMAAVSALIAAATAPMTATGVKAAMPNTRKAHVETAIAYLTDEGYVTRTGARGRFLSSVKPYTDPDPIQTNGAPPHTDDEAPSDYSDEELFHDID